MNRTDRSIWNNKRDAFVLKGLAASLMLAFGSSAYALPTDGVVADKGGNADIGLAVAGKMIINQSTQNVAINWKSFSIGTGETVQFVQPNSASVALNRVTGSDASSIMGSLSANGKVFLVNPNGILFAQGAQVNVGGLVASTRNIEVSDFMAGNYKFAGTGGGTVVNQGSINADGGYVALLGASVSNEGVISARLGTVVLAAGNAMTLDVAGDGLLNVAVNEGAVNALAHNGGLIRANGGQVLLTALSAGNLLQSAVNNTGVIQAQTVENHNGTIRLLADMQSGTVNLSGTLDASGTGAGQTGGSVTVTGHHVGLFGGHINASGDAGGGTVLVGGGYQGNNPAVQNASATYMSKNSTINVDAITNGNGGTAVLWSNDSTRAYGSFTARGGAQGGNGGLIETSGHWLDVAGIRINAGAPHGQNGTWLLDPANVTITGAPTSNATETAGVFSPNTGQNASNIFVDDITNILNGVGPLGTNVTITTTNTGASGSGFGDITVAAAITWNGGASATGSTTLTLNAAQDVNINAVITATNGNLVVCCGRNITVTQTAPLPAQMITTTNGSVLFSAGGNILINGAMTTTDGNVAFCAGGDIRINSAMTLTNGNQVATQSLASLGVRQGMTLSAGNAATGPGLAGGGGAVVIAPPGGTITVTQGGAPTTAAPVTVSYNPLTYTAPVTDFSGNFTAGTPLTTNRLVFPGGADKVFDGTTTAVFTSFQPDINGVVPGGGGLTLAGGGTANFANVGPSPLPIPITYSGFTLGGASAGFALPTPCCGVVTRTTGNITAAPVVVAPAIVPPVIVPPVILGTPADGLADGLPLPLLLPAALLPAFLPIATLSGIDLTVEGIRMPAIEVVQATPPPPVVIPPPVVVPPVYVPPVALPPRQTRN